MRQHYAYCPIIAPYVTYSIQPDKGEVSATYGKDYPILTCSLAPTPVKYTCLPITPDELTLFMQSPFDDIITVIVKSHFPIALDATFKRYKYFQKQKYCAQAKVQVYQSCLEQVRIDEDSALEKAMC